jgi:hypothetical protein
LIGAAHPASTFKQSPGGAWIDRTRALHTRAAAGGSARRQEDGRPTDGNDNQNFDANSNTGLH